MVTIEMASPDQAAAAMRAIWPKVLASLSRGIGLQVTIQRVRKTREQEKMYHAMIGEIAHQAQHCGARWDAEAWKRLLLHSFARETGRPAGRLIPTLDGSGVIEVGVLSRKFSVEDASDFVEWLHAWCANNGVTASAG